MQLDWDIFCRVIDNYGDAGICWRLARQLQTEHGKRVRLWIDNLDALAALAPGVSVTAKRQYCEQIEIRHWGDVMAIDRVADVVIEAFACELPDAYLAVMSARPQPPCWINLEYLTAEPWAEAWHGMASPHPTLALTKHFFFPGFTPQSGGLLREGHLPDLAAADADRQEKSAGLDISLFCYESAPVASLIRALGETGETVRLHVAPGKAHAALNQALAQIPAHKFESLQILPFPFLPQKGFDQLLSQCDINFVRGEDSLVRAIWSGRPFVWQTYIQEEDAHLVKLDAFLDKYLAELADPPRSAVQELFQAWNRGLDVSPALAAFLSHRKRIASHTREWAAKLAAMPDLTAKLVTFCRNLV